MILQSCWMCTLNHDKWHLFQFILLFSSNPTLIFQKIYVKQGCNPFIYGFPNTTFTFYYKFPFFLQFPFFMVSAINCAILSEKNKMSTDRTSYLTMVGGCHSKKYWVFWKMKAKLWNPCFWDPTTCSKTITFLVIWDVFDIVLLCLFSVLN